MPRDKSRSVCCSRVSGGLAYFIARLLRNEKPAEVSVPYGRGPAGLLSKVYRAFRRAASDINGKTFARLVPMSPRNLANIKGVGKRPSANVLRQLQELRRVVDAFAEVIQKDAIEPWLEQPNSDFRGLKAIEAIERCEVDRIWQMIYNLRSGVPS